MMLAAAALWLLCVFLVAEPAQAQFGPSQLAITLQEQISRSVAASASALTVPPGDYYFGNASLLIHHASNFALSARDGPARSSCGSPSVQAS